MQSRNAKAHKAGKPWQVVTRPAEIQDEHKEDQARQEQTSNGQPSAVCVPRHPQPQSEHEENLEKVENLEAHVIKGLGWTVCADVSSNARHGSGHLWAEARCDVTVIQKIAQSERSQKHGPTKQNPSSSR